MGSYMNQAVIDQERSRKLIKDAEDALLQLPQIKLEAKHYLCNGLYTRELWMPKGSAVTGKIHIKDHIVTIVYGDVTVRTDDGLVRYTGYQTFVGKGGSKRALLMHEDTLWLATHATDKKTVEECEATLVTNTYEEYLKIAGDSQYLLGVQPIRQPLKQHRSCLGLVFRL